jgi:organic hydroperoxide reductase OsmC/OhrA
MEKLHEYETSVAWTGSRKGQVESPGLPTLTTGAPPDFGGEVGIWSPEHFFVASIEVCTMLTFLAISELSKLELAGWSSSARGKVEKVEGRGFEFTAVEVHAQIKVKKESDLEKAERVAQKAERHCLVTNSLKTPVQLKYEITAVGG